MAANSLALTCRFDFPLRSTVMVGISKISQEFVEITAIAPLKPGSIPIIFI
jgi:hypothetical protein